MKCFTELFTGQDETNRTNETVAALEAYFYEADAADAAWARHFLCGRKLPRTVTSTALRTWVAEEANLPLWLVEECQLPGSGGPRAGFIFRDNAPVDRWRMTGEEAWPTSSCRMRANLHCPSRVNRHTKTGMHDLTISLQALVAASVFFVWVVRYDNIIAEFAKYGLPASLRDLVGILKLTFALLLLIGIERKALAVAGGLGIAAMMAAAFVTHLRVKNSPAKMAPCLLLLVLSLVIAFINYRLLNG